MESTETREGVLVSLGIGKQQRAGGHRPNYIHTCIYVRDYKHNITGIVLIFIRN